MDEPEYPSVTGKTLTSFPRFGELPTEIKLMIWERVLDSEARRIITYETLILEPKDGQDLTNSRPKIHALFHTCCLSREVARKRYNQVGPLPISKWLRETFYYLRPLKRPSWIATSDIIHLNDIAFETFHAVEYSRKKELTTHLMSISNAETLAIDQKVWNGLTFFKKIDIPDGLRMPNLKRIFVIVENVFEVEWTTLHRTYYPRYSKHMPKHMEQHIKDGTIIKTVCDGRAVLEWKANGLAKGEQQIRISLVTEEELEALAV